MAMETYSRTRSKKAKSIQTMDKCCQKDSAEVAQLQQLSQLPPRPLLSERFLEPAEEIEKFHMKNHMKYGDVFEIDHVHLPAVSPSQLMSLRVVVVCEKTESTVTIRFPSMASLRAFFIYSNRETHPNLDEKFEMTFEMAEKVLIKLVPIQVFSEQKSSENFWLIDSSAAEFLKDNHKTSEEKKGTCLSVLNSNGMVNWGIRRQAKYLGKQKEADCFENGVESVKEPTSIKKEEKDEDEDDEHAHEGTGLELENEDKDEHEHENEQEDTSFDKDNEEAEVMEEDDKNLKRKRYSFRNHGLKKFKFEKYEVKKQIPRQNRQGKGKNKVRTRFREALVLKDSKDRWSTDRYKLAEKNLFAVMKLKGATAENPLLRPQLREEARKKIGDTGLLDHLLKHMAGKLAPGGQERFRRRHNPDGAMEYWLENADLANIRKDAGVSDPFWVPPPGWKLGDSPNQDPICARELKLLKDELIQIRRDMQFMEEENKKLRRELEEFKSNRKPEESHAVLASSKFGFIDSPDSLVDKYELFSVDI